MLTIISVDFGLEMLMSSFFKIVYGIENLFVFQKALDVRTCRQFNTTSLWLFVTAFKNVFVLYFDVISFPITDVE